MNPEIVRNAWIETTPVRLVLMVVVLGLIFAVAHFIGVVTPGAAPGAPAASVFGAASTLGSLILILWGARNAAEGVLGEIKDRTWDFQRLSALSPFAMTIGKLFGPTLYVWFGGALCLSAMVISGYAAGDALKGVVGAALDPGFEAARLALSGLLAQSVALAVALSLNRSGAKLGGASSIVALVAGLVAVWIVGAALGVGSFLRAMEESVPAVSTWWGWAEPAPRAFEGAGWIIFAAFGALAVWRLMRRELQLPSTSWAFLSFALFLPFYFAGFQETNERASVAYFVAHLVTIAAAFIEPKSLVGLRRLISRGKRDGIGVLIAEAPATLIALAVALATAILAITLAVGSDKPDGVFVIAAMAGFLVRDVAIILFFHLRRDARRAGFASLLTLALAYGAIGSFAAATGSPIFAALVLPSEEAGMLSALSSWAQAGVAVALMWLRARAELAAPPLAAPTPPALKTGGRWRTA
jgi:hypothetical protein